MCVNNIVCVIYKTVAVYNDSNVWVGIDTHTYILPCLHQ